MKKEKLFHVIADCLSVPKSVISSNSNLMTLCLLSEYLSNLNSKEIDNIVILKNGLEHDYSDDLVVKSRILYLDFSYTIKKSDGSTPFVKDYVGKDGFTSVELGFALIFLTLEWEHKIYIPDEVAESCKTCQCILNFLNSN
jgi:hypothetical protein